MTIATSSPDRQIHFRLLTKASPGLATLLCLECLGESGSKITVSRAARLLNTIVFPPDGQAQIPFARSLVCRTSEELRNGHFSGVWHEQCLDDCGGDLLTVSPGQVVG